MKYSELNLVHRKHINSQIHSDVRFEWQDQHVIDVFLGALPPFRRVKENEKIKN